MAKFVFQIIRGYPPRDLISYFLNTHSCSQTIKTTSTKVADSKFTTTQPYIYNLMLSFTRFRAADFHKVILEGGQIIRFKKKMM